MRSNNDDDVQKAIKYSIWTSTPSNNQKLSDAWEQRGNRDVYLFYSVVKSGQFVGVARLLSGLTQEDFAYWWQPFKWKNYFKVEWLFIKDIPYKAFDNLNNMSDMPVIRSKDTTEVDWNQTGKTMLQIFKEANNRPSIFDDFPIMD